MNIHRLISSLIVLVFVAQAHSARPLVVGYYPSWNRSSFPHTAIRYEHLTHIVHSFLIPNADGSLGGAAGFAYPDLVQSAHARGVKVIVSLGGWGQSDGFSPMAADTAARSRFVNNLKSFCVMNGYDGVDLDWEYPKNATDRTNMRLLVRELRIAFNDVNPPLQLSMAGPSTNWSGQWFDLTAMSADFDWVGIMTYDFYGSWTKTSGPNSPIFGSFSTNTEGWIDYSVEYYSTTRGVPKQKLCIGIPFYGWMYTASSMYGASSAASQLPYSSIAPRLQQGWSRYWDDVGQVPYMINSSRTQVISYDDSASIEAKARYIKSKGVAGTIVWAIGQDNLNGEQPLLSVLGAGLYTTVWPVAEASVPGTTFLSQNYPNPCNPVTRIRYHIVERSEVVIKLYDSLGREIRLLVSGEFNPGVYELTVPAEDLSSGVYMYRMMTNRFSIAKTMVVLR